MEFADARDKFIQTWGTLATQWGINRTMAQIHALLMISPESMDTDGIMAGLQISRGNANMNLRDLMDWGLVFKQLKTGERREFFYAEKDIWKVARQVVKERRRREIAPVLTVLDELKTVKTDSLEAAEFAKVIGNISRVANFADTTASAVLKAEENWLVNQFFSVFA
ncbi:GbsR/MarR family transcriptional regulator [Fibrella aquatilis]|uniref:HTH-type transcriptional regulator n=1 Tax=Fibrella aquatilis TaxID=2817059 RepID=A0A939G547_9BACT|nr:transcriptional regulator [Fibrella aquatilis]MBO0930407.1 transcriptional regulator [Fibrella aquatilis]